MRVSYGYENSRLRIINIPESELHNLEMVLDGIKEAIKIKKQSIHMIENFNKRCVEKITI